MHFGQSPALVDGKLPVFIFPTSLNFYSNDQSTHKQVLTLYNPYDFGLKFKVLCNSPKKYSVVDSEGSIKSRCCVDIVIRHKDICINNEDHRDKFRIHVSEIGQKQVLGSKDVIAVLFPKKDSHTVTDDKFESLSIGQTEKPTEAVNRHFTSGYGSNRVHGPSWVVILSAVVCVIALMMPTTGDITSLPHYLILSVNQKLIAAYILGLVTMAILKS